MFSCQHRQRDPTTTCCFDCTVLESPRRNQNSFVSANIIEFGVKFLNIIYRYLVTVALAFDQEKQICARNVVVERYVNLDFTLRQSTNVLFLMMDGHANQ